MVPKVTDFNQTDFGHSVRLCLTDECCRGESKCEMEGLDQADTRRVSSFTLSPFQTTNSSSNDRISSTGEEQSGESEDQSD